MTADREDFPDRGEPVSLMAPMSISATSRYRGELSDLAVELAAHSSGFRRSLIEGHDTHPVVIEHALKNDYSSNTEQRNLQLEAKAHITVQQ